MRAEVLREDEGGPVEGLVGFVEDPGQGVVERGRERVLGAVSTTGDGSVD